MSSEIVRQALEHHKEWIAKKLSPTSYTDLSQKPSAYTDGSDRFKVIEPYSDPNALPVLVESAYQVQSCIDAIRVNTATDGFNVIPSTDFKNAKSIEQFEEAVQVAHLLGDTQYLELEITQRTQSTPDASPESIDLIVADVYQNPDVPPISPEVMTLIKRKFQHQQKMDSLILKDFINNCSPSVSWRELRDRLVTDWEIFGYAFLEVVLDYDNDQRPIQLVQAKAAAIRITVPETDAHFFSEQRLRTPCSVKDVQYSEKFRLYVQNHSNPTTRRYFKNPRDKRIYSSITGKEYVSINALRRAEPQVQPANGLIHFCHYSAENIYGKPKWLPVLDNMIGTSNAENRNSTFFKNNAIPPGFLFLKGFQQNPDETKALEDMWSAAISGSEHGKIPVLQAQAKVNGMGTSSDTTADVKFVPFYTQTQNDGQFLDYTNRNGDSIGQAYRLGRPVRGDMRDLNRSTAKIAVSLADKQVFEPRRSLLDEVLNQNVLPALGVYTVRIASKAPDITDTEEFLSVLETATTGTMLTINETRSVLGYILGTEFPQVEGDYGDIPSRLLLAGLKLEDDKLTKIPDVAKPQTSEGGPVNG